jgi:tryptophan synthase alpha chain
MGRIDSTFAALKTEGRTAFVAYITAGDPNLSRTVELVREFDQRGVDIVELGVPFSDPVADGPVNQEAAMRALDAGTTLGGILDAVRQIRKTSNIPIIFFTYLNTLLAYGLEKFADDAVAVGVDGALVLDMPPEEAEDYKRIMDERQLATVFLVSPITPPDRIETIVNQASGFVYYVSQMGVTGERERTAGDLSERIGEIRACTAVPVVIGFGISRPEHVADAAQHGDGVVVGSAIVRHIAEQGDSDALATVVGEYVETLTTPLRIK